ncbi:MAG TPA: glycosyltransferase family A protein [Candidatus Binatia bacterium]
MSPVVSVIIPTFNRWPLVGEAVESVFGQSYSDFELIVVDDGSTDETQQELAKFRSRLRLFVKAREGVATARNFGVSQAVGRYIAFLDSDDLWQPKKLEIQTAFMEKDPSVQICQTEEIWLRHGVRVNPKARHQKPSGDIFVRSLELCLVSPSAVMMTKELFSRFGGFDEKFPVCEDYDLWLRIAVEHPVPLIPKALIIKRGGHADQLSRSMSAMDRYRVAALQKLLRSSLQGTRRARALAVLRSKVAILAQGARKRGKEQEANEYEAMTAEFDRESVDVGDGNSRLHNSEGFSPEDAGALA